MIAEASWVTADHRAAAAAMADSVAADIVQLRCTAPAELTARRMSSRTGSASDAGPEVAERMTEEQAPWPEAITIDTDADMLSGSAVASADPVQRAFEALRPHEPPHLWRPAHPYNLPD